MDTTAVHDELARLRAEVAELRAKVDGAPPGDEAERPISRRALLTLGGAAAAGAAATLLPANPAGAAVPDAEVWRLGQNETVNTATATTGLRSSANPGVKLTRTVVNGTPAAGTGLSVEGSGTDFAAVHGINNTGTGTGVKGEGVAYGVQGTTPGSIGVLGRSGAASTAGALHTGAVKGDSTGLSGVVGSSDNNAGVVGVSKNSWALGAITHSDGFTPSTALGHLLLYGGAAAPPTPAGVVILAGSFYLTSNQDLLHNKVNAGPGIPGSAPVYVRVGYTALTSPYRLVDTRIGLGGGTFAPNERRQFTVAGTGTAPNNVPVAAAVHAVTLNVTAVNGTSASYATVLASNAPAIAPGGDATYSNLNWITGQTQANQATVKLHTDGKFDIFARHGTVNIVVDVVGYFS